MNVTEPELQDPALVGEVDLARAAAQEEAGDEQVGEHVGTHVEGGTAVTHLFEAAKPGYHGWRWAVTVASAGPDTDVTVSEVVLLPGPDALVAPDWVPWENRVQAGDLGVGDLLPTAPDDPRLVPAYVESDDPAVEEVAHEAGLGRARVLTRPARLDVAARWQHSEFGPRSDMARGAPAHCGTCGFYLPLAGSLRVAFGTCGNEISPADGHVVHVEYGCGAHSEAEVEQVSPVLVANLIYDDALLEVVSLESAEAPEAAEAPAEAAQAPAEAAEAAGTDAPPVTETVETPEIEAPAEATATAEALETAPAEAPEAATDEAPTAEPEALDETSAAPAEASVADETTETTAPPRELSAPSVAGATGFVVASSGETTVLPEETSPAAAPGASEPSDDTVTSNAPHADGSPSEAAAEPATIDEPVEALTDTSAASVEPPNATTDAPAEPDADTGEPSADSSDGPIEPSRTDDTTTEPNAYATTTAEPDATTAPMESADVTAEPNADIASAEPVSAYTADASADPAETADTTGESNSASAGMPDAYAESETDSSPATSEPVLEAAEPVAPLEPVVTAETDVRGESAPPTLTPWIRPEGTAKQAGLFDDEPDDQDEQDGRG